MRLMGIVSKSAMLFLSLVLSILAAENDQVDVHDPAMAKEGDTYYLFSSGPGIPFYSSKDMKTWILEGRIFPDEPSWARRVAPGFNSHVWAPDILKNNGKFYLYYSVSAFGKNTSAIGLTINKTLDKTSPDYQWVDQGVIVQSVPNRDLWNGIDSSIEFDEDGNPWMVFGSWWSGIKLVRLDETWTRLAEPQEWFAIAKRDRSVLQKDTSAGPAAIEGPFLFKKGEYYYLFVSTGLCCRGKNSTYRIEIGRSKDIRGPYLDKEERTWPWVVEVQSSPKINTGPVGVAMQFIHLRERIILSCTLMKTQTMIFIV